MTAAINSRSSVSGSAVEPLDTPEVAAAPAAPRKASNDNRVESWAGQPRAQRSSTEVLAQLDRQMMRNSHAPVRDFFVTERDAREAVGMLGELSPAEYKKAIDEMNPKTMNQLLCEMDADTRKTFFDQARNEGAVKEEAGVKMPPREGSPPDKPALLRNDPSLRSELRTAIHEENKARTSQYMRDFDGYVSRYSEAALNASSPLALRMIGPPVGEFVLSEPGVLGNDKGVPASLKQGSTTRARAARAANDRISDFAGRTRAGSFSATADLKFGFDVRGNGAEASYNTKLTGYGKFTEKLKGEAEVAAFKGVSVGIMSDGKTYQDLGAGDFRVRLEKGKVSELEAKVAGVGVSLSDGKSTLSMGGGAIPIGTFATIDEKHGSFGGGVKLGDKVELGGMATVEASVKLGVSVQGIAPERLADIASMKNDGIWGPMPELDQRVKWSQVPAARRERLARDGWSAENWPVR